MPDKLPKGWTWAHFSDLFQVMSDGGRRIPQSEYGSSGMYPIIDQGEKDFSGFTDEELTYEGELPVILFGDHTRRFKLVEHPFVVGAQGIKILSPTREVPIRFLWFALNALKIESRGYSRHFQFLKNARIPLPPLPEQARIVAKLDDLLSRVAAAESATQRATDRLQRYRASVLHTAVTGKLTYNWRKTHKPDETGAQLLKRLLTERRGRWEEAELKRLHVAGKRANDDKWKNNYVHPKAPNQNEQREIPKTWTWASIDQLGDIQLGRQRSPKNVSNLFPTKYLRAANITEQGLDLSDVFEMEFNPAERERYALESGDVLLSEASGSASQVGKPAIWRAELPLCCFQNTVIRLQPTLVRSEYILAVFKHFYTNGVFAKVAGGVGINHLGSKKFSEIAFPLAPLEEQNEIVREVERRTDAVDHLIVTLTSQFDRAEALRQSLLREAFRGKLVAQDSNDQPAAELISRIRRVRKIEAKKPKEKRMSKRKQLVKEPQRGNLVEILRKKRGPMTPAELFKRAGYDKPIDYSEVNDPIKAVEAFYAEVSRLIRDGQLFEKRSPYDRGMVHLEVKHET